MRFYWVVLFGVLTSLAGGKEHKENFQPLESGKVLSNMVELWEG